MEFTTTSSQAQYINGAVNPIPYFIYLFHIPIEHYYNLLPRYCAQQKCEILKG